MSAQREQNSFTTFKPPSMEGLKPHLDIGAINIVAPPAKQSFWRRFITLMDVSLLKDRGYLNILFGLSIFYVAEMNFKMITPFFFVSLGYSKSDVAFCLSITAISDISSRTIFHIFIIIITIFCVFAYRGPPFPFSSLQVSFYHRFVIVLP